MGLRFPSQKYGQCFFVSTTFKEWEKLGNIKGFYKELLKSIDFCLKKYSAKLIGYVFMPSHIHLLILINGNDLGDFMRDFKKYISQKVAVDFGIKGGIWMPRYDRVVIHSIEVLKQKLEYIHLNPVRGNLVRSQEDWVWSSAKDYLSDRRGEINIFKEWV
ncbi:MAG: transposase [bacterium]